MGNPNRQAPKAPPRTLLIIQRRGGPPSRNKIRSRDRLASYSTHLPTGGLALLQAHPAINHNGVKSHGCHCSKFEENMFQTGAGLPVDDLDILCQDWYNARRCITLPNGICSNGMEEEYQIPAFQRMDPKNCRINTDLCSRTACVVDLHYINEIFKHSQENRGFEYVDDAVCAANERTAIDEMISFTDGFQVRGAPMPMMPGGFSPPKEKKQQVCRGTAPDGLRIETLP